MPLTFEPSDPKEHHINTLIDVYGSQTTLATVLTDLKADTQTAGYTYPCPKCNRVGDYAKSVDSGNASDTEHIDCTVCEGIGYTNVQYRAKIVGYEQV